MNQFLLFIITFFAYLSFSYGKDFYKIKNLRPIKIQKSNFLNVNNQATIEVFFKYNEEEKKECLIIDNKFLDILNNTVSQEKRMKLSKNLPNTDYIYYNGHEIIIANNQHFWFFFFLTFLIVSILSLIIKLIYF